MGVNSLPKTVTRQRRDCDLNPGPSVLESSTLTTRLPSHPTEIKRQLYLVSDAGCDGVASRDDNGSAGHGSVLETAVVGSRDS